MYASKLRFVEFEGEVWRILLIDFPSINSQETTATTGISDLLPQAVSNPIQSDLERSLSQDLWNRSCEEKERLHLQNYFNSCENGWYCKICSTFAPTVIATTPFVNKAGTFGDHPTCNANRRLQTQNHKDVISNKLAFNSLRKRWTDVWKLLQEAALSKEISVTATNRFVIKSFFRITWLLIKKNRTHSHNFKSVAEVVAACGREEIQKHLLHAPQNANYMSHEYISKYIQIMDDHIKLPLLASLRTSSPFTFSNSETSQTSNVTTTKQMTVYATFNYQGTIKEHYAGIIPISKLVGNELSAPNIMKALTKFFGKINILIMQARFSCIDITNVNSGSHGGLKRYILHKMMALWVGCGNHKLALCFKPLLKEFPCVAEFDLMLLSL